MRSGPTVRSVETPQLLAAIDDWRQQSSYSACQVERDSADLLHFYAETSDYSNLSKDWRSKRSNQKSPGLRSRIEVWLPTSKPNLFVGGSPWCYSWCQLQVAIVG